MKLALILLICSLAVALAFQRGGGSRAGGGRPAGGRSFHSAPKVQSRPAVRQAPRVQHSPRIAPRPAVSIRPVNRAPPKVNPLPKAVPKPQIKPAVSIKPVMKAPPKVNPLPKAVPKPQVKPPIIKAPPKANPLPKAVPKPQIKPAVIVKAPNVKPVAKTPIKPAVAVSPAKVPVVNTPKSNPPPKVNPQTPVKPPVAATPAKVPNAKPVTKPNPAAPVKPPVAATPAKVPNAKPVTKPNPPAPVKPPVAATPAKVPNVKPVIKPNPPAPIKPSIVATPAKVPNVNPSTKVDPKNQITGSAAAIPGKGVQVNVDAKKNIWESQNKQHSVDATAGVSKTVQGGPKGNVKPDVNLGGQYSYNTDKTQITASASGKPGQGIDLKAEANRNLWESQNQRHSIDATAGVSKHLGGPQGNTKKDVNLGGQYSYNTDKTQITASANGKPGKGVDLNVAAKQNLWESQNKRHSIDATAEASKHIGGPLGNSKTDLNLGAQYKYGDSKTQIITSANGGPGKGVQLGIDAKRNLWESGNKQTTIDVTGGASKQIGGPNGNGKPEAHVGLEVNTTF